MSGMRKIGGLVLGICIAVTALSAAQKGKAKGKGAANPGVSRAAADSRFGQSDIRAIQQYYGANPAGLPPGLQKKLARGKPLPPGWQKKLGAFPAALDTRLGPACGYCGRGVIDGYGVLYDTRTAIVLDVVRLAGNLLN